MSWSGKNKMCMCTCSSPSRRDLWDWAWMDMGQGDRTRKKLVPGTVVMEGTALWIWPEKNNVCIKAKPQFPVRVVGTGATTQGVGVCSHREQRSLSGPACGLCIPKCTQDPGEFTDLLSVKGNNHARRSNYCQII